MNPSRSRAAAVLATLAWAVPAVAAGPLDILPGGAPPARPPAKAESAPAPAAIPVPGVVPAAVEAYRTLSAMRLRTDPDDTLGDLLAPVDEVAAMVERTAASLARKPLANASDRDLADLRQEVLRQDATLGRWGAKIQEAVKAAHASKTELERMAVTWRLTEEQAAAEGATEAIVSRAASVRREVDEIQKQVRIRLDRLLAAQDRVATLRIQLLGWQEEADRAEVARRAQLFEIESKPIWKVAERRDPLGDFGSQLRGVYQHNVSTMEAFVQEEGASFLGVLAVFAGVVAAVAWAGRRFARRAASDPELAAPAEVLAHPIAAGTLVALALTAWLLPRAPAVFSEISLLLMLPSFLLLARNLLAAELREPLYGFTALYGMARLAALLPESSLPGRLLSLVAATLGLVGAARLLRPSASWPRAVTRHKWIHRLRTLLAILGAFFAVSIVANVVGNVSLARRLADGTLTTGMLGMLLAAVTRVLRALVVGGLRMPEVRRLPVIADNTDRVASRTTLLLEWGAFLVWVAATLRVFHVSAPVTEMLATVFGARLKLGGIDVSLGDLTAFAVTLWLAVQLARFVELVLEARLSRDARFPPGVPDAIARTAGYALLGMGFLVAVLASGMDVTRFTVILGTLSVGIGFGLQNVVNNFVSGLILLYERPIRVGDVIDLGSVTGQVTHIGIRSSTIKTFQGAEVVMPNSNLVSNQLVNWTLSDHARRVEIDVGVAYGSDVVRVQEILVEAARSGEGVLPRPEPTALFTGFGDSALNFQLRFWTGNFESHVVLASEVRSAIVRRLEAAGIGIPFPQRDLHVVSVEEGAARSLRGGAVEGR